MLNLTVPGVPAAKQRARVCKTGFSYTPKKTLNYETFVRELFAVQYPGFIPLEGPVLLRVRAFFPIPGGASKRDRQLMESGTLVRDKRPDVDNLVKIIGDALNGLAFRDDGQIAVLEAKKLYGSNPRLEVEVERIT